MWTDFLLSLLEMLLLGSASLRPTMLLIGHCLTIEKVIEKVLWSNEVTLEPAMVEPMMMASSTTAASLLLSFVRFFTPYLIVYASLFRICETSHRSIHFLEGVSGFRG